MIRHPLLCPYRKQRERVVCVRCARSQSRRATVARTQLVVTSLATGISLRTLRTLMSTARRANPLRAAKKKRIFAVFGVSWEGRTLRKPSGRAGGAAELDVEAGERISEVWRERVGFQDPEH